MWHMIRFRVKYLLKISDNPSLAGKEGNPVGAGLALSPGFWRGAMASIA
jgi:hypothetical protein